MNNACRSLYGRGAQMVQRKKKTSECSAGHGGTGVGPLAPAYGLPQWPCAKPSGSVRRAAPKEQHHREDEIQKKKIPLRCICLVLESIHPDMEDIMAHCATCAPVEHCAPVEVLLV